MNFEKIGKVIAEKTKELAGQTSADGSNEFCKEEQWIMIFSAIATISAFMPFVQVNIFRRESYSLMN